MPWPPPLTTWPRGNAVVAGEEDVGVAEPVIGQPVHCRPGVVRERAGDAWLHVPLVERHVLVEQRVRVVGDAALRLEPGPGGHDEPGREPGGAAGTGFRLGHEYARSRLGGRERGAQARGARARDHHVVVGHCATSSSRERCGRPRRRCRWYRGTLAQAVARTAPAGSSTLPAAPAQRGRRRAPRG